MALIKVTPQSQPQSADHYLTRAMTPAEIAQAHAAQQAPDVYEAPPPFPVDDDEEEYAPGNVANHGPIEYVQQQAYVPMTMHGQAPAVSNPAPSSVLTKDFSQLSFDWTSFPSISLKPEGEFVDIDGVNYGKELVCFVHGWKPRWVYRANPVMDNKRDVDFSYDRIVTQKGAQVSARIAEWNALGKTVEEKEYLEVVVEMIAPEEAYDGEYRILSVSPTSKGRFAGYISRAAALSGGDPSLVKTKVKVGAKITKVANAFFPWAFELYRG